jgi:hypothetical protein
VNRYVEYGALSTAPGPLRCEKARIYCFFLRGDRDRVQALCDRVLRDPTGGAVRYVVPRLAPVILTFGALAGLRSAHPEHAHKGSALEPEAAIWIPTIAHRFVAGTYRAEHLAVFMPYIWVDDPIAFASGREVYGFAKTQGWMIPLGDPRDPIPDPPIPPDPPAELHLDVYGAKSYAPEVLLGHHRLITISRVASGMRGGGPIEPAADGADFGGLLANFAPALARDAGLDDGEVAARRSMSQVAERVAGAIGFGESLTEMLRDQVVRHVFLKQFRDAGDGSLAALQQVVEARSVVTPGTLRWRRLGGRYDVVIDPLDSQPLGEELGVAPHQTVRQAFAAEFGFTMEPGTVVWPAR